MWLEKSYEFWAGVLAASVYVYQTHKEKALPSRLLMVVGSSLLGVSLASEVSASRGAPETLCAVLLIAGGYLALDIVGALIQDRKFLQEILSKRFGK